MTPQVNILLTMMSGQKENGGLVINPFFNRTEEEIKSNFDYACEVYKDVFRRFISAWFLNGDRNLVPPLSWENLKIRGKKEIEYF